VFVRVSCLYEKIPRRSCLRQLHFLTVSCRKKIQCHETSDVGYTFQYTMCVYVDTDCAELQAWAVLRYWTAANSEDRVDARRTSSGLLRGQEVVRLLYGTWRVFRLWSPTSSLRQCCSCSSSVRPPSCSSELRTATKHCWPALQRRRIE